MKLNDFLQMKQPFIWLIILCLCCQANAASKDKPTVRIIGDSTVKNGDGNGTDGLWGWGNPLALYFDTAKITVENHALGGTSSRTFQTKGLWKAVLDKMKKGDFVLMQFGHNDGGAINDDSRARGTIKGIGDETESIDNILTKEHEIVHTYGWYLRKMIRETKAKGAIPIIVTPIPRNDWENGHLKPTTDNYPQWAIEVAMQENVQYIDLNKKMSASLDALGENQVTGKYFYSRDHTHTSAEGAKMSASLIIQEILNSSKCKLKKYLLKDPKIIFPVKKHVFIIGDSTVADGNDSIVGWGHELPAFFDTSRIILVNKARGGRSSRTFQSEGLWSEIVPQLQKGDFVLMQFGHNDGGAVNAEKHRGSLPGMGNDTMLDTRPDGSKEIVHSYGWYMKKYITDTKAKGATPILFSPIPRNEWRDGKVERIAPSYGKWAKETAVQTSSCFIDLNELVAAKYETIGQPNVKLLFPGDHTHTNQAGAWLNASIVAQAIRDLQDCKLKSRLLKSPVFSKQEVLNKMVITNAYFMKKWPDPGQIIVTNKPRASNIWTRAVYYEGLMALQNINHDSAYYNYARQWGEFHHWGLNDGIETRNADNHCCGQTYLELYMIDKRPEQLKDIKTSIDLMLKTNKIDDWNWIDALQMGMPVFARLAVLCNDNRYYERMYEMYMYSKTIQGGHGLFNPKDNLWWRDKDFVPPTKEPNGKDCYWSRGNGWVLAALVRVLEIMPKDAPHRLEYEETYLKMVDALLPIQREDGFWNASLHDPSNFGGKELSGTALFVYGIAWGINHGILSKKKYLPVVERAWKAMVTDAVHVNGLLGYVQGTGKQPSDGQPVNYDHIPDFEDYGLGCFLLAGSQVYPLCN